MGVRRRGGQPGNQNARVHGFYAKHFKEEEASALDTLGTSAEGVQAEIDMLRVVRSRPCFCKPNATF